MTENVPEASPKYVEVAKEYEEDVLVIGVPEAFTNFSLSGSYLRQASVYNPYFSAIIIVGTNSTGVPAPIAKKLTRLKPQ
jgi:hypothetical protein